MMATPDDLEDFAFGFSLTENIIEQVSQLYDVNLADHPLGTRRGVV